MRTYRATRVLFVPKSTLLRHPQKVAPILHEQNLSHPSQLPSFDPPLSSSRPTNSSEKPCLKNTGHPQHSSLFISNGTSVEGRAVKSATAESKKNCRKWLLVSLVVLLASIALGTLATTIYLLTIVNKTTTIISTQTTTTQTTVTTTTTTSTTSTTTTSSTSSTTSTTTTSSTSSTTSTTTTSSTSSTTSTTTTSSTSSTTSTTTTSSTSSTTSTTTTSSTSSTTSTTTTSSTSSTTSTTTTSSTSSTTSTTTTSSTSSTTSTTKTSSTSSTTSTTTTPSCSPRIYTGTFVTGIYSASLCSAWITFVASLSCSHYSSFTINGTYNAGGLTASNQVTVNAVATALRTSATYIGVSNGATWYVGVCGSSMELANVAVCQCLSGQSIRPCVGSGNWGGIANTTCNAVTQQITLAFY